MKIVIEIDTDENLTLAQVKDKTFLNVLEKYLELNLGTRSKVYNQLCINRKSLYRYIKMYGIDMSKYPEGEKYVRLKRIKKRFKKEVEDMIEKSLPHSVLSEKVVRRRIAEGWSVEAAFNTPEKSE